jgi:hypothetical protein
MDRIILQNPAMALRLAEILFSETQVPRKLEWFKPLKVEDQDEVWFVSGNVDPKRRLPPEIFGDQEENPIFGMYVAKTDSEVKDINISIGIKLPPEVKAEIRGALEAEGRKASDVVPKKPRDYSPGLWICEALHGGVINSTDAAIQFAELVFDGRFALAAHPIQNLRAELVDGIWHVSGRTDGGSAELVFRRSNAQVISLDVLPIE